MGIEESLEFGRTGRLRVILQDCEKPINALLDLGVRRVRGHSSDVRLSALSEGVPARSGLTGRRAGPADRLGQLGLGLGLGPGAVLRAEGTRT